MGVERREEAEEEEERKKQQPPPPQALSPWDCGSPLYDAFELASVYRVLDTNLMALPHARRPSSPPRSRGAGDATALAERAAAVAVAKATGRSRRRRAVAKAARRTGKAVLHSIFRSVAACGGQRA